MLLHGGHASGNPACAAIRPKTGTASHPAGAAFTIRYRIYSRADGTVTAKEKARINRAQNAESRAIYRQKHDAQKR